MAPVPFSKNKPGPKPNVPVEGRMPDRMTTPAQEDQTATAVGSKPMPAPPVDGSLITHDTNYPRPAPKNPHKKV